MGIICPHCQGEYSSQSSLQGHVSANHWKKCFPHKHGKPSRKREVK